MTAADQPIRSDQRIFGHGCVSTPPVMFFVNFEGFYAQIRCLRQLWALSGKICFWLSAQFVDPTGGEKSRFWAFLGVSFLKKVFSRLMNVEISSIGCRESLTGWWEIQKNG